MSVMSIRIDDDKRKALKVIASIRGMPMGKLVSELIEEYINENLVKMNQNPDNAKLFNLMKMSEQSFAEWDNEEDGIYDDL